MRTWKSAFIVLAIFGYQILPAHPLGIFSVNRYTRIEPGVDTLKLMCVIDIAEIPTIDEFKKIDLNNDGVVDEQERNQYVEKMLAELKSNFHLEIDQQEISVKSHKPELSFPEGQGGLKTTRFSSTFVVPFSSNHQSHEIYFSDNNFKDRIGWKEVIARPQAGINIESSSVPENDLTEELRHYPQEMIGNPLRVSEAMIRFAESDKNPALISSLSSAVIIRARDGFAELISTKELSLSVMIVSLLIAMMLGAGHALTPGHGKTIVAAYLVGQRGTAKHAAFLGLTVTATHTIGVFAIGFIALFASKYILPENLFPWLGMISGLILVGIGVSLFMKRLALARGRSAHDHDEHSHEHGGHGHNHGHSYDGHTHSHLPVDGTPVTWKSLLALGVSGGLLPCPSAIVVLLSAIALGRIGFGLTLIVAFSIGLAGVLTGIGLLMVYARKFFERFNTSGPVMQWVPVLSAAIVTVAGVIISLQAFGQTGIEFMTTLLSGNFLKSFVLSSSMVNAGALSILGFGFILGLKHALDSDHLIAVSTIVSERKGFWSSSIVGALWGLGHTASLLIVGLIVIAFNFQIPDRIAQGMEFSVALMLIILGANVLWKILRGGKFHVHTHTHDHHLHVHPHIHERSTVHSHDSMHHHKTKVGKKPFFVGMVHGMAGSAALMLVVLATISSRVLALAYIAIFGIGSVGGMFLMSALIGLPFALTSKHERINTIVRTSAGILSLCFGLFYAYQIGISW